MKAYLVFDNGKTNWVDAMEFLKAHGHEIEIPEGADGLSVSTYHKTRGDWPALLNIPLPRPKKKVKKYRYAYGIRGMVMITMESYASEEEFKLRERTNGIDYDWYHRIPETMIEVEE